MANSKHLEILKKGVSLWNKWRDQNPNETPDLSNAELDSLGDLKGVNFSEANLSYVHHGFAFLSQANLSGANLSWSTLIWLDFSSADLSRANLTYSNIIDSNFRRANLSEANLDEAYIKNGFFHEACLSKVNLKGAQLIEVNLGDVDLSGAILGWTTFGDVDLSNVRGLESVQHHGPSTIGVNTIYKSRGKIPEPFLKGVGLPETFIIHISSLTDEALYFYSCFICYSNQDQEFAKRLHTDLQSRGVRCWFASEDMKIGDRIRDTIDQAIKYRDRLLLVLSDNSIKSQWVEKEVETAFEEERNRGKLVLFPIRLDSAVMDTDKAWAADIRRTRHIGNFSAWRDHDAYKKAFDRLLRDLKQEGKIDDAT